MSWTGIENAIHAIVVSATGLAAGQVIWSQQGGPTPQGQFISLRFIELDPVGQDFQVYEENPDSSPGAELLAHTFGLRRATLQVTCFAGSATGATMPLALLDRVVSAFHASANRDQLSTNGAGFLAAGPIRSIDGIVNYARFEPRAIVDLALSVATDFTATLTEIISTEITDEIRDPDVSYTVEKPAPVAP